MMGKQLVNVADPTKFTDVCTMNYIARLLSKMFLSFYTSLTPNGEMFRSLMTIPAERDKWINDNIIYPFFMDPNTKVVRDN